MADTSGVYPHLHLPGHPCPYWDPSAVAPRTRPTCPPVRAAATPAVVISRWAGRAAETFVAGASTDGRAGTGSLSRAFVEAGRRRDAAEEAAVALAAATAAEAIPPVGDGHVDMAVAAIVDIIDGLAHAADAATGERRAQLVDQVSRLAADVPTIARDTLESAVAALPRPADTGDDLVTAIRRSRADLADLIRPAAASAVARRLELR